MRLLIDVIQDRGPRCGKARHGFEEGVGQRLRGTIQYERQHTEKREDHPCACNNDVTILSRQRPLILSVWEKQ